MGHASSIWQSHFHAGGKQPEVYSEFKQSSTHSTTFKLLTNEANTLKFYYPNFFNATIGTTHHTKISMCTKLATQLTNYVLRV